MKHIVFYALALLVTCITNAQSKLEKRLDSLLQRHVNSGTIHGCVVYVYQNGKVILNKPYGYMNLETKRPMEPDAIFRIASMTKALTAITALKLYEDGKFRLDEPVKKYIPEFANLQVLSSACKSIDSIVTVPLERDVTIRDLFRHTAGFGYGGEDIVGKLYEKYNVYNERNTLKQFVQSITKAPLKYQPGSKWEYSFANDILGYLIEVISGKPLDVCMQEVLFKPLHMDNTGFQVSDDKIQKLCNFYKYADGKLQLMDDALSSHLRQRPSFISGGGGAVSTVDDYSRFCQMLLNYGKIEGKQFLLPETVELFISNQIGEITDRSFPLDGFGLGIGVTPVKYNGGTAGCHWAGSPYNDTYQFSYSRGLIAIMLMQNAPWEHLGLMDKFQTIVNEEIK